MADFASLEDNGDTLIDNSASFVNILAEQVDSMRSVYEESNAVKEKQRVLLDKRHAEVQAELAHLQNEITTETLRFTEAIGSLDKAAHEEIAKSHALLLDFIKTRFQEHVLRMEAIEAHQAKLDADLAEEVLERHRQTEQLVGGLRDQLIALNTDIGRETEIRKDNVSVLKKSIEDKTAALHRAVDAERFQRDLQTTQLKDQLQQDLDRTNRRQLRVIRYSEDLVDGLAHAVRAEAKTRGATQTSIVQCVTVFVEKFKTNLDAENYYFFELQFTKK